MVADLVLDELGLARNLEPLGVSELLGVGAGLRVDVVLLEVDVDVVFLDLLLPSGCFADGVPPCQTRLSRRGSSDGRLRSRRDATALGRGGRWMWWEPLISDQVCR
ncbi:MAG: hypothetical protein IRZ21_11285 [Thermoleophilaceae bacterium]|nr:hypothetical protein [Thermoleophilaceae bacterium]